MIEDEQFKGMVHILISLVRIPTLTFTVQLVTNREYKMSIYFVYYGWVALSVVRKC